MLLSRPPLATRPKPRGPSDLHVLGTPPAFILSQDQTLHRNRRRLCTRVLINADKVLPLSSPLFDCQRPPRLASLWRGLVLYRAARSRVKGCSPSIAELRGSGLRRIAVAGRVDGGAGAGNAGGGRSRATSLAASPRDFLVGPASEPVPPRRWNGTDAIFGPSRLPGTSFDAAGGRPLASTADGADQEATSRHRARYAQ